MSSELPATGYWMRFFTDAGIPASVAANYAITFVENRIKLNMLMDLNKDYLREMGITALGDVIAVLKHAVSVYRKEAREKVLSTDTPAVPPAAKSESPKRSTPATRMLEHYMRKEIEDSSPSLVHGPQVPPSLANKLGKSTVVKMKKSLTPSEVEIPAKKVRRVLPEHEGRYKVTLPKGTTQKTRKILQERGKSPRKSVFDRLGDSSVSSTTEISPASSQKITVTGVGSEIVKIKGHKVSVFERLGGKSPLSSVSSSTQIDGDGDSANDPLEYQGIFKTPAKSTNSTASAKLAVKQIIPGRIIQHRLGTPNQVKRKNLEIEHWDDNSKYSDGYTEEVTAGPKSLVSKTVSVKAQRTLKATATTSALATYSNKEVGSIQERLGSKSRLDYSSKWKDCIGVSQEEQRISSIQFKKIASKVKQTGLKTEGILAAPSNLHKPSVRERLGRAVQGSSASETSKILKKPIKTKLVKLPGLSSDQQRVVLPSGKVGILNVTEDGRKFVRVIKSTKTDPSKRSTSQHKKSDVFNRLGM